MGFSAVSQKRNNGFVSETVVMDKDNGPDWKYQSGNIESKQTTSNELRGARGQLFDKVPSIARDVAIFSTMAGTEQEVATSRVN